jgi:hypothetical protein
MPWCLGPLGTLTRVSPWALGHSPTHTHTHTHTHMHRVRLEPPVAAMACEVLHEAVRSDGSVQYIVLHQTACHFIIVMCLTAERALCCAQVFTLAATTSAASLTTFATMDAALTIGYKASACETYVRASKWMSHATWLDVPCDMAGCPMRHGWVSHATWLDVPCDMAGCPMRHGWMSHATWLDVPCDMAGCSMRHGWMSHATWLDVPCDMAGCPMRHGWMSHVS